MAAARWAKLKAKKKAAPKVKPKAKVAEAEAAKSLERKGVCTMLGNVIYEGRGKRTGRVVLPLVGTDAKVEVSFEDSGKLLGTEANFIGTYWATTRPDGTLYGEGQAVIVTGEGDLVTARGIGTGMFRGGGAVAYRGCLIFHSTSQKLVQLNSVAGAFEFEVDAEGNTHLKIWEWK